MGGPPPRLESAVKHRPVILLLAVALLAIGCGSRVHDDALAVGNGALGGQQGQTSSAFPAGGAATGAAGSPAAAATAANLFGTLEIPCGPGDGTPRTASDKGITADEISITTISDPGGPKPGLDQGIFDSMDAFAAWCNSLGGINGRKLKVNKRDAKITQYKEKVAEACQDDFAMVGGLGVLDQLGAQDAVDCGLVNVPAAAVSAEATGADRTVQPQPNPINNYLIGPAVWVKDRYPDAVKKAGAIYSKFTTTETQSNKLVEAYQQVGFDFIYHQSANVNETNWGPLVVAMKNQGVKYLTLTSSFEEIVPLQKEMAAQNYKPDVIELETNFYNYKYPEQAGDVANGTFTRLTAWPFEEADANPAMKKYLELLTKTVPDAKPELLGVQAFSAGLLFATAMKKAGANPTRETLLQQLQLIHEWNGGGLHGTSDPGGMKSSTCFIIMKVDNGKFVREYPLPDKDAEVYKAGNGMACPPRDKGIATLTGDYGTGAKEKGK